MLKQIFIKSVFPLNVVVYMATLVAYINPIAGLFCQFFLGCSHLFFGIVLYLFYNSFDAKTRNCLNGYWILVMIYAFALTLLELNRDQFEIHHRIVYGIVVPMLIGAYFLYVSTLVTFHTSKQKHV